MEYRKLIKFGNSSSVISMPKSWLEKNNINKGDLVYLEEKDDELTLSPHKKELVEEEKELTIDVSEKDRDAIQREVVSAYINNFNKISIIGNNLGKKADDIRTILHGLVALEIMEQTPQRIIAKDFLNMKEASIGDVVRKIDITLRSMLVDCKSVKEDESIENRDQDVNRLSFLVLRAVKYGMNNPPALKIYEMDHQELMDSWWLVVNMEKIADEVKRVLRFIKQADLSVNEKKEVKDIIVEIEKMYLGAMKSYYTKDKNAALDSAKIKRPLMEKCTKLLEKYKTKPFAGNISEKLKNMISYTHNIIRMVYS